MKPARIYRSSLLFFVTASLAACEDDRVWESQLDGPVGYTIIGCFLALILFGTWWELKDDKRKKRLLREGRPVKARVIRLVESTHRYIPSLDLDLELLVEGEEKVVLHERTIISWTSGRHDLEVGSELPLRVDPDDLRSFVIDWETHMKRR